MYKVVVSKNSVQIPAVIDSDDDNDEVRNLRVMKIYEKEKEEKMKIKFPEIDYAHISVDVMGSYTAIGDNSGNIKVSKIPTFRDAVDILETKLSTIKSNASSSIQHVRSFILNWRQQGLNQQRLGRRESKSTTMLRPRPTILMRSVLILVGYTMSDIHYKWNDGLNSVQVLMLVSNLNQISPSRKL